MIELRPYMHLGQEDYGWLQTRYHFSFANYFNPARMGWGKLRVWNDDIIASKAGFPPHAHQDMEIITFVRQGAISHQDSQGHKGKTIAGNVQVMTAGSGIRHSEYNLENEETRIFQIWIETNRKSLPPSWNQKEFPKARREGKFDVLASNLESDKTALKINSDAKVLGMAFHQGQKEEYHFENDRLGYLVVSAGKIDLNGFLLKKGDGAAIEDEKILSLKALEESEVLLVDTAP
ncbi:pirin family protein [Acetobacteraceae bacterium]|nr:pirin family protein [Acetobacteraceae bacterium]